MANILTSLKELKAGVDYNGVALIKSYSISLTKQGKEYIQGVICSGVDVPFKAWGQSAAFASLKKEDYCGMPTYIVSSGEAYGGTVSLILESVQAVDGFTVDQFLPAKYNIEGYFSAMKQLVASKISPELMEIANKALFDNEDVCNKFKLEFAASGHHDNCKGGLLAHTHKVLLALNHVLNCYPALCQRKDESGNIVVDKSFSELLYFGVLFHDLGKIWEMNLGVYQSMQSTVTHRYLVAEYMQQYKTDLVSLYGEKWWYDLVSIFLQHHGEYADPPKTLAAYIVHLVDNFDSEFTLLSQLLDSPLRDSRGSRIKRDIGYLYL